MQVTVSGKEKRMEKPGTREEACGAVPWIPIVLVSNPDRAFGQGRTGDQNL